MKSLAMFPGQGSQSVGMGKLLVEQFPYAAKVFEEVDDTLGLNIGKLCFQGPEDALKLTANTQPSILAVSVATWTVLKEEAGFDPDYFAGHSLGEYSALVAAGLVTLSDAATLVRRRGEFMQEAVPEGTGAMAAVLKVDAEELENLCAEIAKSTGKSLEIANYNSPQQLVVAGHSVAVERLSAVLTEQKKRCVMLAVSAPFHSSLMGPAKEKMAPLLKELNLKASSKEIYANLSGKIEDYHIGLLIDQIDHPVRWTQTIENSSQVNMQRYVEVGPGNVLFGLARRTLPRGNTTLLHTHDENLLSTLKTL